MISTTTIAQAIATQAWNSTDNDDPSYIDCSTLDDDGRKVYQIGDDTRAAVQIPAEQARILYAMLAADIAAGLL